MTIGLLNEIREHKWTPQWIQKIYNQIAELNKGCQNKMWKWIQKKEIMKNYQSKISEIISKIK